MNATIIGAMIGLGGAIVGVGISYFLAVRREVTEERNWRRERVLEVYSQFLAAVDMSITATTNAYGAECGTAEHAQEGKRSYEEVQKMYHQLGRVGLLASDALQSPTADLAKHLSTDVLVIALKCPKAPLAERKASNERLAALMATFMVAARHDIGANPPADALERTEKRWWQFWR
jgi:hypothetical protein